MKKFGPRVMENFGHLYRDGEITAVVRDLRLLLTSRMTSLVDLISQPCLTKIIGFPKAVDLGQFNTGDKYIHAPKHT